MKAKRCRHLIFFILVLLFSSCANNTNFDLTSSISESENVKIVRYSTVAKPLSNEELSERGFVSNIATNYENVLEYIDSENSKTLLVFSAPIENSLNEIITTEDNNYSANGSYFVKYLPSMLSKDNGISINSYMKIFPADENIYHGELTKKVNAFSQELPCVEYDEMFGKDTTYNCYATSFGVNTEIVLNRYTQINTFRLKIQFSENLVPDTGSPDYILLKATLNNGEVKSIIYTPLAVDANGKWCYANSVKFISKDSNTNTYTLEYTVNKEFLEASDTRYPVKINQSIHRYKPKQPDTSTYSKTGEEARHYLSPYMLLGDNTIKGEGWVYVRYETLQKLDIDPEKIISAKYTFCNLFDLQNEAVIAAYAVTADWCSINTLWFNRPAFDENKVASVQVKEAGVYQLDITPLFKEMLRNKNYENAKYSINNSFLIKSETKNSNMIFPSGDNGLLSPYLEIKIKD